MKPHKESIHQIVPFFSYGDAISIQALLLQNLLREEGHQSDIFVAHTDNQMVNRCKNFSKALFSNEDTILFHYSINTEIITEVTSLSCRKILIYHNITPAHFFRPYSDYFSELLREGRENLKKLAPFFEESWGDSEFNVQELDSLKFKNTKVMPLIVDQNESGADFCQKTLNQYSDDSINIIFVGRIAPNKRQDELVLFFAHFQEMSPNSRLFLVGDGDIKNPHTGGYVSRVKKIIKALDLEDKVIITGKVSHKELNSYYSVADLFISLSEHEGFCIPLIEAQLRQIPVIAFDAAAIPETLNGSGYLIKEKRDLEDLARTAYVVATDHKIKETILSVQTQNAQRFSTLNLRPKYLSAAIAANP